MRSTSWVLACALVISMTGCSRVEEAAMDVPGKVNAAYPPAPEVQAARDRLIALLADDSAQVSAARSLAESRMTLRALACAQNARIGRLDSVASVRARGLDQQCFQAQDQALLTFFGVRTIGVLLTQPPLRPLKPAGPNSPLPKGQLSHIHFGTFARDAGVAVLRDNQGAAVVVEVPGGAPIATLPQVMASEPSSRLSPNGRVFSVNALSQGTSYYDTATGHKLWEAPQSQQLLVWLPEVTSFIFAERNGATTLADGMTGTLTPHPVAAKNASFAAHLPGTPARTLIGSSHELALVEHTRGPNGVQTTAVRTYRLGSGAGITSGQPVPMLQGKRVVFASMRHIGWLDLESGASDTWRTSPTFGIPFAKLDETRLLLDSVDHVHGMGRKAWAFDIAAQTVAPVDLGEMSGLIVNTGDRVGFMRRGEQAWFGDVVKPLQDPAPLDQVAADHELKLQLAKLEAQARDEAMQARAPAQAATPARPAIAGLPGDAQVHMIGVYEGSGGARASGSHPTREVRVVVRRTSRPIVLALSSYEPVRWHVTNAGARIAAVLLSGYHPSSVVGPPDVPVMRTGSEFAYRSGSREHAQWRDSVQRSVGPLEIRSFQGVYSGADFSVGGL